MTEHSPAIEISDLRKQFGEVQAVDGVNLVVQPGETVALLGANGAGKSTTISILLGLTRQDSGTASLFGMSPASAVQAGRIGAMLQGGRLPDQARVSELVGLARAIYPNPLAAADIYRIAGLDDLERRHIDKLSGGEAQRVRFAFALSGDPELLVLDEPTAAMDVAARQRFWEAVRSEAATGRTVLFATHYLIEADEFADRVIVLSRGRVVADGTSAELRRNTSGRLVSFELGADPVDGLDRLPGVRAIAMRGSRVVLTSDDSDATVVALIQARGKVCELEISSGGLTEAFLALTGPEAGG